MGKTCNTYGEKSGASRVSLGNLRARDPLGKLRHIYGR
jgi:hypothetical protein